MFRGVCILVLVALSAYVAEAGYHSQIMAAHRTCFAENNLAQIPSGGNFADTLANDRKIKCISACIWREMGWLNEDQSMNVTRRIQSTPDMPADEIRSFNECSAETDPDICERVYKFYACLQNKAVNVHGKN